MRLARAWTDGTPTRLDGWQEGWRAAPAQLVRGPCAEHAQANVPGGGGSSIHAPAVSLALVRAARASLAPHRWSDCTSAGEEGPVATLRAPARRRSVPALPALLLRAAADASIFVVMARPDPPPRMRRARAVASGQPASLVTTYLVSSLDSIGIGRQCCPLLALQKYTAEMMTSPVRHQGGHARQTRAACARSRTHARTQ